MMPANTAPQGTVNLSIVVPAYNEAANVAPVVNEILQTLSDNPWVGPYEVVLVNDGSRDETGAIMDRLAQEHSQLTVAHHETNRGFGAALKTGFARSRGRYVTLITADGEIGVDQPLRLFREMSDHDLILSRRERTVGVGRTVLTWGVDWMVRLILGFWLDNTVGIYVVRGDLVRSMPLYSGTGLANLEVILQCQNRGCKIARSGVTETRPRLSGESKVTNLPTIFRTLWEMLKLRWRIRRQRVAGMAQ